MRISCPHCTRIVMEVDGNMARIELKRPGDYISFPLTDQMLFFHEKCGKIFQIFLTNKLFFAKIYTENQIV